ncbi:dentin sialophosphoprotein-like [Xenia sp. Carnegie-2017]|uniref:dentin sialophosphoprotein-like n=1 Tax=Xenia sp. Carnegie-2017 TaxID=2897299 RepID=UPI001F04036A|nr:dentin sialophosphoprotein-like [Xenia sp. Carnegie-2017]
MKKYVDDVTCKSTMTGKNFYLCQVNTPTSLEEVCHSHTADSINPFDSVLNHLILHGQPDLKLPSTDFYSSNLNSSIPPEYEWENSCPYDLDNDDDKGNNMDSHHSIQPTAHTIWKDGEEYGKKEFDQVSGFHFRTATQDNDEHIDIDKNSLTPVSSNELQSCDSFIPTHQYDFQLSRTLDTEAFNSCPSDLDQIDDKDTVSTIPYLLQSPSKKEPENIQERDDPSNSKSSNICKSKSLFPSVSELNLSESNSYNHFHSPNQSDTMSFDLSHNSHLDANNQSVSYSLQTLDSELCNIEVPKSLDLMDSEESDSTVSESVDQSKFKTLNQSHARSPCLSYFELPHSLDSKSINLSNSEFFQSLDLLVSEPFESDLPDIFDSSLPDQPGSDSLHLSDTYSHDSLESNPTVSSNPNSFDLSYPYLTYSFNSHSNILSNSNDFSNSGESSHPNSFLSNSSQSNSPDSNSPNPRDSDSNVPWKSDSTILPASDLPYSSYPDPLDLLNSDSLDLDSRSLPCLSYLNSPVSGSPYSPVSPEPPDPQDALHSHSLHLSESDSNSSKSDLSYPSDSDSLDPSLSNSNDSSDSVNSFDSKPESDAQDVPEASGSDSSDFSNSDSLESDTTNLLDQLDSDSSVLHSTDWPCSCDTDLDPPELDSNSFESDSAYSPDQSHSDSPNPSHFDLSALSYDSYLKT